jgi:hypothetical protein
MLNAVFNRLNQTIIKIVYHIDDSIVSRLLVKTKPIRLKDRIRNSWGLSV